MAVESFHPLYTAFQEEWITQRDMYGGESVVKQKGHKYLPPTPSMVLDGVNKGSHTVGSQNYEAYKVRALFPDYFKEAVEILVGMLHFKPPTIELPTIMEPMLKSATLTGEGLADLLRKINTEQLIEGRIGVLADLPAAPAASVTATPVATGGAGAPATGVAGGQPLPYLATYVAESMINWDDAQQENGFRALNLVILNETGFIRDTDFTWKIYKKFRLLQLGDITKDEANGTATYSVGIFDQQNDTLAYNVENMKTPMWRGNVLNEIPFAFIGTKDLVATPDYPPLSGLAKLVLAIYRADADYRQNLFMQGQDTLVVIGQVRSPDAEAGDDPDAIRVGAGSRIDVDIGGDAKYVGVTSTGLPEQGKALAADHQRAAQKSGQLIANAKSANPESGEALKTRIAAQTASLTQIAITGAKGLESVLKSVARWVGADPEQVKVTPNMEFGDLQIDSQDIGFLMAAKLQGFPISKESLHQIAVEKRLTTMTFEDETATIEEENAQMPPPPGAAGAPPPEPTLVNPNAPGNKNKSKPANK